VSQNSGQFTQIFRAFAGGASSTGSASPTTSPTPTPTPTATSTGSSGGSCAAAWSSSATYVSGNEVSYNGDNWTANQWNYNEVPGGASGAWNNDGAC
jgi:chitinase